jgi:hypothetical protein
LNGLCAAKRNTNLQNGKKATRKAIRFSGKIGNLPVFSAFYCLNGWAFSLRSMSNRSKSKKPMINTYFLNPFFFMARKQLYLHHKAVAEKLIE